jgi:tetratricopeptide (TPR) repeat protein
VLLADGSTDRALPHLQALRLAGQGDAEVLTGLGRCFETRGLAAGRMDTKKAKADALKEYEEAGEAYRALIAREPVNAEGYVRLARLLRGPLGRPAEADKVVDEYVAANPKLAAAYLARAAYRRAVGNSKAEEDVAQAMALEPADADVLLACAEAAARDGKRAEARDYLATGLKKYETDPRFYKQSADVEAADGKPSAAEDFLKQGLTKSPGDGALLLRLTELQIEGGDLKRAQANLGRLRRTALRKSHLDFLQAGIRFQEGAWREAGAMLARVGADAGAPRELKARGTLLLARCWERLGDADGEVAALSAVRDLQAGAGAGGAKADPQVWRALALAQARAGRINDAVKGWNDFMRRPGAPDWGWALLARLGVLRNARLAPDARSWRDVDAALDQADRALPGSAEPALIRADALAARRQTDAAREVLTRAHARHPKQLEVLLALAELESRAGHTDDALRALDRARAAAGDLPAVRLAHLQVLLAGRPGEASRYADGLWDGLGRLSGEDRVGVRRELSRAYLRLGRPDRAVRLLEEVSALRPDDLENWSARFDLAVALGDRAGAAAALEGVRTIEGPAGVVGRCGEAYLLIRAGGADAAGLDRAGRLLDEAAKARPNWSRVELLRGELADLRGATARALEHYRRAIALGETGPGVVRRAVELFVEARDFAGAERALALLADQGPLTGGTGKLAAEVALWNRDFTRAYDRARGVVAEDNKRPEDHLWLGQLLARMGKIDDAERAFRRAVEVGGPEPEPWVMLVRFYVATGQKARAEEAVREVRAKVPSEKSPLALARCYEALGDPAREEEQYRAYLRGGPDDPDRIRQVASFYLRAGQGDRAAALLRRVVDGKVPADEAQMAAARRDLAAALASAGGYAPFREALGLLDRNLRSNPASRVDLRAKAATLAQRPGHRSEAVALLERLKSSGPLAPGEQFLLARLYRAGGQHEKCRDALRELAADGGNPTFLAFLVDELLERNEPAEAERWLTRLEEVAPDGFEAVTLRARLLARDEARKGEAVDRLKRLAEKEPGARTVVARLLERELNDPRAAEDELRLHLAGANGPEAALELARFLGRQGRLAEALDLCERGVEKRPAAAALAAAAAFQGAAGAHALRGRVEALLARAAEAEPHATPVAMARADFLSLCGDRAGAADGYRRVLAEEPDNPEALNNLAFLLALDERGAEEALGLVQRAIEVAGPSASFLDTRAFVHLAGGQTDEARKDVQEALRQGPSPGFYFRLAQVRLKGGDRAGASAALHQAQALGLTPESVHPLERKEYKELCRQFPQRSASAR